MVESFGRMRRGDKARKVLVWGIKLGYSVQADDEGLVSLTRRMDFCDSGEEGAYARQAGNALVTPTILSLHHQRAVAK